MQIRNKGLLALLTVISLWGTVLSSSNVAQESSSDVSGSNDNVTGQIELTRSAIQTDRQSIVTEYMVFTEEESQEFWPLYKQYRSEVDKVNDQLVKLILDYSESYKKQTLSDEQAEQMLSTYLKLEEDKLEYQKKYVPKFSEILPPKKVTRYFQLENKMDAVVKFDLAGGIPLVE